MSIMMQPVLPAVGPEISVKGTVPDGGGENSFASHLDRQLDEKYGQNRDKLGVPQKAEHIDKPLKKDKPFADKPKAGEKSDANNEAATLLAQFMAELQDVAQEITAPGEWNVVLPDTEVLHQLAVQAGMSEEDFSQLMQQVDSADQKVGLADFFAALNKHFENIQEDAPITVPETELPMLEALLAKMGVPQEVIATLSEEVVVQDGKLDLTLFFQELMQIEDVQELKPVTLSDWEAEQLQNLLDLAGVQLEKQNELLPERFLNQVLGKKEAGQPVQLTLERLQNIVKDAVVDIRTNEPQVNLPAFLNDLQKIVAQSGFESKDVGWTPVVQESVNELFKKIQEIVDLAKVKVEEDMAMEDQALDDDLVKWVKEIGEKFAGTMEQDESADFTGRFLFNEPAEEPLVMIKPEHNETATLFKVPETGSDAAPTVAVGKEGAAAAARNTTTQQMQQQVIQQLSAGVIRGLKNQEHHLVLRLYPQDLGEVKVNLTVRDEHVSVSFNMENSKVKEMLESNMEQFKDSMNQRGFSLGECNVSVGQQDDDGGLQQRFEMARTVIEAARKTASELPEDALYLQEAPLRMDGRQDGISLIV